MVLAVGSSNCTYFTVRCRDSICEWNASITDAKCQLQWIITYNKFAIYRNALYLDFLVNFHIMIKTSSLFVALQLTKAWPPEVSSTPGVPALVVQPLISQAFLQIIHLLSSRSFCYFSIFRVTAEYLPACSISFHLHEMPSMPYSLCFNSHHVVSSMIKKIIDKTAFQRKVQYRRFKVFWG